MLKSGCEVLENFKSRFYKGLAGKVCCLKKINKKIYLFTKKMLQIDQGYGIVKLNIHSR